MTRATSIVELDFYSENIKYFPYLRYFIYGLLLPLGFAPFHLPGLAILGLALFYNGLMRSRLQSHSVCGLLFGLGFFGFGISWIYISIHEYGHLHGLVAGLITFLFLLYLSLFPALVASIFSRLLIKTKPIYSGLIFSALWILSEYLRGAFLSGFPWLLLGFGQFDTPLKFLLPIFGVFGSGFISCFAATLLAHSTQIKGLKRGLYLFFFVAIILFPLLFKDVAWAKEDKRAISVGVIQANLSMRDKWDEKLFWHLLQLYKKNIEELLGTQLIVLPESAIPLPAVYVSDFLHKLQQKTKQAGSALLLGIPYPSRVTENHYFNALMSIGHAKGSYFKQHLVPFGEYTPSLFQTMNNWLGIPPSNLLPGNHNQALVNVQDHPIASLICYELAYGDLLRKQLPDAEWIVSISDDGWFGHSLAIYQQLQMAQVLALETARFHVVANNDGLSSVIDTKGKIISVLPAYSAGVLQATIFAASGSTPWITFGDSPILLLSLFIVLGFVSAKIIKRRTNS